MFKTLRNRLLAWFLVFSVLTISIIVLLNVIYFYKREHIANTVVNVDAVYIMVLHDFLLQSDFFTYGISDEEFFDKKTNAQLVRHKAYTDSIQQRFEHLKNNAALDLKYDIEVITKAHKEHVATFDSIVDLIYLRGYKNYQNIGNMREHIHRLEENKKLDQTSILSLRRREKDYIIRHERAYIDSLGKISNRFRYQIESNPALDKQERAKMLEHLDKYMYYFNRLVELDQRIGLNNESGLHYIWKQNGLRFKDDIKQLHIKANHRKAFVYRELKIYYLSFSVILVLLGITASVFISNHITAPLTRLSNYITRFISNDFDRIKDLPALQTNDEVSELSQNFNILKNEITDHIELLNQKVQKRTAEILKQKNHIEQQNYEIIQAEKELIQAKAFAESIINTARNGIIVLDMEGFFIESNAAFLNMTAYNKSELVHKSIDELIPNKWKDLNERVLDKLRKAEPIESYEIEYCRADGTLIPVAVSSATIMNEDNNPSSIMAIVTDITQRRKNEEELEKYRNHLEELVKQRTIDLQKAKEKAEKADQLKSAFLANMSHEIRTPMNSIIGFSEMLAEAELTPQERKNYIDYIQNSGDTLLKLINDIIDIAKIEADQLTTKLETCNLKPILHELHSTFSKELERREKHRDVKLILTEACYKQDLFVETDPLRFRQILSNLMNNAIKFTHKGSITFGYKLLDKQNLEFYVEDTGIGIRAEKQKTIFERFDKIEEHKTAIYGGTGLGLTISKNLVERLGGTIRVESEQGQGSTFFFTLPNYSFEHPDNIHIISQIYNTSDKLHNYDWSNYTFLVAEDEELNYALLKKVLQASNVKLLRAKNGKEAVSIFKNACQNGNSRIDLVLMDMLMPELNGYEATKQIKSINSNIPVIAQTALAMSGERERSFEAGCDDHITKPYRQRELFGTLARFVENNIEV